MHICLFRRLKWILILFFLIKTRELLRQYFCVRFDIKFFVEILGFFWEGGGEGVEMVNEGFDFLFELLCLVEFVDDEGLVWG